MTAELVGEGLAQAERAIEEIRELARGIHPAILTDRGLVEALSELTDYSTVPVSLEAHLDRRLPAPVEVTVYYVVSEALTNGDSVQVPRLSLGDADEPALQSRSRSRSR